ncbi:MAG TPA: serine hydrolase domain-containing protein [Candidatus Dormibacteraeota bacterium]|nr:serine hydrolase domain-containing protein [Candidatus Dormibacteraeota bacterium]
MSEIQQRVQEAIDRLIDSGAERGLQVAVYQGGKQIVDAAAGLADHASGRRFESGTPVYCFSVVKAAASTIAHILVERGAFTYETPVARLWPEFGARGKEAVTIRQVLNHTAGVPQIPPDTTIEDLCNWDKICAAIADQELWWEPGTRIGYHAYTFGYIVGEVVRRATGKRISQLLEEEIAGPLGISREIYFGMPIAEQPRLARLEDAPPDPQMMAAMANMPKDLPMFKAAPMSLMPNAAMGNRSDVLAADIPAGGKTSARAIARMYAALLGQVDGVRLLSAERLHEATAVSASGVDQVFGMPTTWGLGYSIGRLGSTPEDSPTAFGVGGVGGSFAYGDSANGIALALTKNRISPDFGTATQVVGLVNDLLGVARVPVR